MLEISKAIGYKIKIVERILIVAYEFIIYASKTNNFVLFDKIEIKNIKKVLIVTFRMALARKFVIKVYTA